MERAPLSRRDRRPERVVSLPRALSKLGLCSRTQALRHIAEGRVSVNGRVADDPALRVSFDVDRIALDGVAAAFSREPVIIAVHKPLGYVTTRSDPQGRPTVYDLLPKLDRFVFPVGRLDKETSGLLLFTDDHQLGEDLTNPGRGTSKTYQVDIDRAPDAHGFESLRRGLDIGRGERTLPARVRVLFEEGGRVRLEVVISEGKNRQIRRMFAAVGCEVLALKRTAIGTLGLGDLPPGKHRRLTSKERRSLYGFS